jgi:hypothetical protein
VQVTIGIMAGSRRRGAENVEGEERGVGRREGGEERVEAWWNPETERWESPAPWNPYYLANAKKALLARELVHFVPRPSDDAIRRQRAAFVASMGLRRDRGGVERAE